MSSSDTVAIDKMADRRGADDPWSADHVRDLLTRLLTLREAMLAVELGFTSDIAAVHPSRSEAETDAAAFESAENLVLLRRATLPD
jgi:hypothetical protein